MLNVRIGQRFHRQKIDDSNGNGNSSYVYPNKIPDPGPYNSHAGFQGMCINNSGHGIGRIVKSVNKFKCKG